MLSCGISGQARHSHEIAGESHDKSDAGADLEIARAYVENAGYAKHGGVIRE